MIDSIVDSLIDCALPGSREAESDGLDVFFAMDMVNKNGVMWCAVLSDGLARFARRIGRLLPGQRLACPLEGGELGGQYHR